MTTLLAPTVPHPIIDRLRGFICALKPTPKAKPTGRLRVEWRCPEQTSRWFRCRRPLPCTSHAIATYEDGFDRTGLIITKIIAERAA